MKSRARADYRLPALDGQRLRARHQRDLPKLVAPVGHRGRDGVVLALMREGALVERLEDQLHLLLEQLAVGVLVEHGRPERLHLAGVVATADTEHDPTVGQPVDGGVILGQPERMPHRCDVEATADLDGAGDVAEVVRSISRAIASLLGNTVARSSSESQRSLTGVPSNPSLSRSTCPANRLPKLVIMLEVLPEDRGSG
jgi:hypothetical protein